jgi:hypothetical protein
MGVAAIPMLKTALRVRDRSGKPAYRTGRPAGLSSTWAIPAATPSGSNARVVGQLLMALTPSGSNASSNSATRCMTPEGSQRLEKRPHATTTLKGSQPELRGGTTKQRVRDRSGKPTARNERGLVADSPTALLLSEAKRSRRMNAGTPKRTSANHSTHQAPSARSNTLSLSTKPHL